MTLWSFKLKPAARTAKSIFSRRLVAGKAGEPRQRDRLIKGRCGGARAYATIDVINWPGAHSFSRLREKVALALARAG